MEQPQVWVPETFVNTYTINLQVLMCITNQKITFLCVFEYETWFKTKHGTITEIKLQSRIQIKFQIKFQNKSCTGCPPLTQKSLTRFPLPQFLAYVHASGEFWQ